MKSFEESTKIIKQSSPEKLLMDRINIRCAMWAAGLISEEELDQRIENCIYVALVLEDGQTRHLNSLVSGKELYSVTPNAVNAIVPTLAASNKGLIKDYLT